MKNPHEGIWESDLDRSLYPNGVPGDVLRERGQTRESIQLILSRVFPEGTTSEGAQDTRRAEEHLNTHYMGARVPQEVRLAVNERRSQVLSELKSKVGVDDPRFLPLKEQFEALPEEDRTYSGKVRTWEEVVEAIPFRGEFLDSVASLDKPTVYWIDEEGQLVVGPTEAPGKSTRGLSYNVSRELATKVLHRGLTTKRELKKMGERFRSSDNIWLESGYKERGVREGAHYGLVGSTVESEWDPAERRSSANFIPVVRMKLKLSRQ